MNNLTDKLSLKNNKPMKPFNRNFLTSKKSSFEALIIDNKIALLTEINTWN